MIKHPLSKELPKIEMLSELRKCVSKARECILKKDICEHDVNNMNSIFETVIKENKENSEKTLEYVKKQTKLIQQRI